jgi:hypothetical protein
MLLWFLVNNRLFLDMGYKNVCLVCRKAFSTGRDFHTPSKCPECNGEFVFYNHKFRPPPKDDLKAWKVVSFLYEHGFTYQHIYKDLGLYNRYVSENMADYPMTLDQAKEFVVKYKGQARFKAS